MKREKFISLAEKRTNNALKQINLIGNLANKTNYDYTEKDVRQIFTSLERALGQTKSKFETGGTSDRSTFKLS